MEHHNFPEFIKKWMRIIESCVTSDTQRLIEYCNKLEAHADEVQSNYLKGYSSFYRGFNCYSQSQMENSMNYFSSALNYMLAAGEEWEMTARIYNSMGIVSEFQGDMSFALDCYINGLLICTEHKSIPAEYKIWSNIGNIYVSLDKPGNAVYCLLQSEQLAKNGLPVANSSRFLVHANLAACHVRLNELEKAESYLHEMKRFAQEPPSTIEQLSIRMIETELYHKTGNIQARDIALEHLMEIELSNLNIFDSLSELCHHARLLLEINKFQHFTALIERIEQVKDVPEIEKNVLELKMQYYDQIGDDENYVKTIQSFYKVSRQQREESSKIVSNSIMARIRLVEESVKRKEAERYNLMLRHQAERDVLTGLYNRSKLNDLAELAFRRAVENQYPFTVEILDIDYFKGLNDHYSHKAGDECLIYISNVFRALEARGNISVVRYGGDEFVIIYENYPLSEVEKFAVQLREEINALNIENKFSDVSDRVTISQGLFHMVPTDEHKLWDFLHGADMALYGIKNRNRDSYYIGTSFEEVRIYSKLNF